MNSFEKIRFAVENELEARGLTVIRNTPTTDFQVEGIPVTLTEECLFTDHSEHQFAKGRSALWLANKIDSLVRDELTLREGEQLADTIFAEVPEFKDSTIGIRGAEFGTKGLTVEFVGITAHQAVALAKYFQLLKNQ